MFCISHSILKGILSLHSHIGKVAEMSCHCHVMPLAKDESLYLLICHIKTETYQR